MIVKTPMPAESDFEAIFKEYMPTVGSLYVCSDKLDDPLSRPRVGIVGSRKVTSYGEAVTSQY